MPVKVGKRIEPGVIPASVMQYILQCLQDICYGQVVLVAQDGRLIQVEREEKLRRERVSSGSMRAWQRRNSPVSRSASAPHLSI